MRRSPVIKIIIKLVNFASLRDATSKNAATPRDGGTKLYTSIIIFT